MGLYGVSSGPSNFVCNKREFVITGSVITDSDGIYLKKPKKKSISFEKKEKFIFESFPSWDWVSVYLSYLQKGFDSQLKLPMGVERDSGLKERKHGFRSFWKKRKRRKKRNLVLPGEFFGKTLTKICKFTDFYFRKKNKAPST